MRETSTPRRTLLLLLALGVVVHAALAAAQTDDHPLVSRYEGSVLKDAKVEEYGRYALVTGRSDDGKLEGETVEGKVTRIVYQNPRERSTLEIFRNDEQALEKAGVQKLYACALDECGPAYARSAWGRHNGLFTAADGDPRYLAGKLAAGDGTAYVAVMVGRNRTQVDVVEVRAMEENLVVADAAALAQGIEREGRVAVHGVYFDTDEADVKPESKPALDEMAKLLKDRPGLEVFGASSWSRAERPPPDGCRCATRCGARDPRPACQTFAACDRRLAWPSPDAARSRSRSFWS
ncbi:MAG: DUF4892 domain-containing protein [Thermodesulfobacteriota bacterium]